MSTGRAFYPHEPLEARMVRDMWALARAHGHAWACLTDEAPNTFAAAILFWTVACAEALVGEPTPPSFVHTTGSGRLTWTVDPGGVTVVIHRPGVDNAVLGVRIIKGELLSIWGGPIGTTVHERHLQALLVATRALGVDVEGPIRKCIVVHPD